MAVGQTVPSMDRPALASLVLGPRGGTCVRMKAKGFCRRSMVATVGGMAFMSLGVGLHGTRQKLTARMAAAVPGSSRPGVSMKHHSIPDFWARFRASESWLESMVTRDGTVQIWDVADCQLRATLNGHDSYVTSVSFFPDGCGIVSGSHDRTVRTWRFPAPTPLRDSSRPPTR